MKKVFTKFLILSIFSVSVLEMDKTKAFVPDYYLPSQNNLKKESINIGQHAYQLLYYGQIKESLNLAKLAIKINKRDARLWLILSETQIANNQYENALISLNEAQKINPKRSGIYFSKGSIYLQQSKFKKAKLALKTGLKIEKDNHNAMFQLGNIFLIEKDYSTAIKQFEDATKIKPDFWQAINNKGLAYFEKDKINLSKTYFKKAIAIQENAEPLLALAACLRIEDRESAISLAKKALIQNPKYVTYKYRKEQLWGEKLQYSTEKLFEINELQEEVLFAKSKIDKSS